MTNRPHFAHIQGGSSWGGVGEKTAHETCSRGLDVRGSPLSDQHPPKRVLPEGRAELKVTDLRWRSPICGVLRFSVTIFGFLPKNLRFSAVCCALQVKFPVLRVHPRKSAVFCENLRFGCSLSPQFRPQARPKKGGGLWPWLHASVKGVSQSRKKHGRTPSNEAMNLLGPPRPRSSRR